MAKKQANRKTLKPKVRKSKSPIKKQSKKKALTVNKMSQNNKWEAENAADTLMRANEIKSNPALMKNAKNVLKKREVAIKKAINQG